MKPRRPRYSLDLLKTFEAAARHMNFTHAARELYLTPSAISRSIKTLEQQFDRSLFIRVDRGLALTDAGQELRQAVSGALGSLDKATGRLSGNGARPDLTITANVATASLWLVPRLPRFAQANPGIDFRVVATNKLVNLEREQVDVAIRHFPPEARPADLEPLMVERVFPVCAPSLVRRRPLTGPKSLARHVLIQFETYTSVGPWLDWDRWLEAKGLAGLEPAGVMRFSHYDHVVQLALRGAGIALGRHPLIAEHLRNGELVAPLGTNSVVSGSLHAIPAKRSGQGPAVRSFIAWLREEAGRDRAVASTRNPGPRTPRARGGR
jgi:DNA-binding transcriptional LysR family regulator